MADETKPPVQTPPNPASVETPKVEAAKVPETPAAKPDAPAAKAAVPEKYELKLPENSTLNAASVEKIASFAKERGLSQDQAQALLEREHSAVKENADKQQESLKTAQNAWLEQAQKDTEIGGDKFKENAELSKRVVERFGSDALKKALNETGLGNHPELVRMIVRIGKAMSEDQLVLPGAGAGEKKNMADTFYGPSKAAE